MPAKTPPVHSVRNDISKIVENAMEGAAWSDLSSSGKFDAIQRMNVAALELGYTSQELRFANVLGVLRIVIGITDQSNPLL
jgi:hypothetical protein